ncbi:MAG: DegV family protein [Oscillospiraceae bacterium]|nr:DegV family protein [Oscillospiraceae bacterium]
MQKRVIIACDSTCDLGDVLQQQFDIKVLPLGVTLSDTLYIDGVTVNPDMIYEHYEKTGQLPKTSALNVGECTDFFSEYTADGSEMVFFTISSELSSTYRNACLAAAEFENVHVVDTLNLSTGGGLLVVHAAMMAQKGLSAKEIADACCALRTRVDASFVVDNLEFLHKGGRCSALTALGANVLQIKPCIAVEDGKMGVSKKYRGKFSAVLLKYLTEQLTEPDAIDSEIVFMTHAGCDEEICQACLEHVRSILPGKRVELTRAGCTVSSHCGRNTLGVLFIRNA